MHKKTIIMTIVAIFFIAFTKIHAQSIESPYEVGTWEGFRSAAVTYTFDDGLPSQITYVVPLFDSLGFKATFYVITKKNSPNWVAYKKLAEEGHEIGSHTVTHPDNLAGMANEETELKNSQAEINNQIPGNQCITIAYPLCREGDISLVSKYYIAGRKCQGYIESKTPKDFYRISAIGCGSQSPLNSIQDLNEKIDQAAQTNGWCVFIAHQINEGNGYSPLASSVIAGSLNYLDKNRNRFWVSTFSNVVRYIKERDSINIKSISNQINSITLSVTDNLPNSIYNVPVTIRRPLPNGWDTAYVKQNNSLLKSSIVEIDSKKYVMFDAIPDKGNVLIVNNGDIAGDLRDDFIGTWAGDGVYYRNSISGTWVTINKTPAMKITAGDLDGDGKDDPICNWPDGVWVKYSQSGNWSKLSSPATDIYTGDINGDGRDDLIGTWAGDGVYYRNSISGIWVTIDKTPATLITAGDLDGDGKDDPIGNWPGDGIYVKYSQSGNWSKLSSPATDIYTGDINGDGRDDLIGTWAGDGVYYRNSISGTWVTIDKTPATLITAGDLDGDGKDDPIGNWPGDGVYVKYSQSGNWSKLSIPATDICTGFMRDETGPELLTEHFDATAKRPGNFDSQDTAIARPGDWWFQCQKEKNLIPKELNTESEQQRVPDPGDCWFQCQ